jgi:hypothetical protein
MVWLVVVKNIASGNLEIITPSTDFDPDNPRYERVVNIIPFKEEPDPHRLDFGVHTLCEACACHPKISQSTSDQTVISHRAAVN